MRWNPQLLDKHVAPGIASFTLASIPDLAGQFPQAEYWAVNYFLNGTLRAAWPDRYRQIVVGFLRRASHAYASYREARQMTLDYLEGNDPHNPRIGRYYNTIAKWETFAIDLTIACDLFKWFNLDQGAFSKNDSSKECRLYEIGNKVKHLPSCVKSGQCTPDETLPLWINASGLNSFALVVTYNEAAEVLADICKIADELQDPLTFVKNTRAAVERGVAESIAAPDPAGM
jgi:hypothetical protein